mgnify:CR=1 FL=1
MKVKPEADSVFVLAGMHDPFIRNPYLRALMELEPADRRRIIHQVILLCAAVDGLDPLGALELLAQVAPFVGVNRPDRLTTF